MVELAQVQTARPRLQLLAVVGVAVEVAVDDDVGVSAPVRWRKPTIDGWNGVADGGRRGFAAGGEVVLAPTEYEWGIGRVRGTMFRSGTRLFLAFLNRRWDALV